MRLMSNIMNTFIRQRQTVQAKNGNNNNNNNNNEIIHIKSQ